MKKILSIMLTIIMLVAMGVPVVAKTDPEVTNTKQTSIILHIRGGKLTASDVVEVYLVAKDGDGNTVTTKTIQMDENGGYNTYDTLDQGEYRTVEIQEFFINGVEQPNVDIGQEANGTVNCDLELADLIPVEYSVTVESDPSGTATADGAGQYARYADVTVDNFQVDSDRYIESVEDNGSDISFESLGGSYQIPSITTDHALVIHTLPYLNIDVEVYESGTATPEGNIGSSYKYLDDPDAITFDAIDGYKIIDIKRIMGSVEEDIFDGSQDEVTDDLDTITDDVLYKVYTEPQPGIELIKEVVDGPLEVGDEVLYTFTVTNTGLVNFDDVIIDDSMISFNESLGALGIGQSVTTTTSFVYSTAGYKENIARADGYVKEEVVISDWDDADININDSGITIIKTAVEADGSNVEKTVWSINDEVWYRFEIINDSNYTMEKVFFSDSMLGLSSSFDAMAPNAPEIFWASKVFNYKGEDIINIAEVIGYEKYVDVSTPIGISASDDAVIDVLTDPNFTVEKSVDPAEVNIGDEVTYTITITNTGDVPLYHVVLEDDAFPELADETIDVLAVSGTESVYSVTYTVTFDDPGVLMNTATVTAYEEYYENEYMSDPIVKSDNAVVTVNSTPGIALTKTAEGPVYVGEEVEYTFTITNTGDVDLKDIVFTDTKLPLLESPVVSLAVDGSVTFTATRTLNSVGDEYNYAEVTAVEDVEPIGSDEYEAKTLDASADATVKVMAIPEEPVPSINIDKSVDDSSVRTGTTVTYTFTISNDGDVSFESVLFSDDMLDITSRELVSMLNPDDDSFDPGDVVEFTETKSFSSEGTKKNIASVDAFEYTQSESEIADATDWDDATVVVDNPSTPTTTKYTLELVVEGGGKFTITEADEFTARYNKYTEVDVSFAADEGWEFVGFGTGSDDADITDVDMIKMDSNKYIKIIFAEEILDVEPDPIPEAEPEVIIPDEVLPKTAGIPMSAMGMIGTLLSGVGFYFRKRKH